MNSRFSRILLVLVSAAMPLFTVACGSSYSANQGSGGGSYQTGNVNMMVSDASTEDWATIGVKILSISLLPQGGGSPVNVFNAGNTVPTINLVELDQLGDLLGTLQVPTGTYTGAILTISGNQGDVTLIVAADPEAGFAGAPGATIPANQIQIVGATGGAGSMTVPVTVNFAPPLVVAANQTASVDVEFDLGHPAFLVGHVPPAAGGQTIWAVNFNRGPVHHHPIWNVTRLVLRHMYGTVTGFSSDDSSMTVTKDYPVEPPTNPEQEISTSQALTILADNANGTLFYDLDAKTVVTIHNFSTVMTGLQGRFARVAARYQSDGSLVAVRIWVATDFNTVWLSPEGHVLHVDTTNDVITVERADGRGVKVLVNNNTEFFYRTPWNAQTDATPIGTGTSFLTNKDLVRGFKIHVSVDPTATLPADPTVAPYLAEAVDIEIARYDGSISSANMNTFTYTRKFNTSGDNYSFALPYIPSSMANGTDPSTGSAIAGFKWWNFTFPTIVDSGSSAIPDFVNATNGTVNFGGSAGAYPTWGETFATWNISASAWDAPWSVLLPTTVPLGTAATAYSNGTFTMTEPNGTMAVTVNLDTVPGSATLVYQVDRTNGIVSVSAIDITKTAPNIPAGTPVKVYGIPQANDTIKAYVVIFFTGMPVSTTAVS